MKIHAVQPWDSPDADVYSRERQRPHDYSAGNLCLICGVKISNDAMTCKQHRYTYVRILKRVQRVATMCDLAEQGRIPRSARIWPKIYLSDKDLAEA